MLKATPNNFFDGNFINKLIPNLTADSMFEVQQTHICNQNSSTHQNFKKLYIYFWKYLIGSLFVWSIYNKLFDKLEKM